MKLFFTPTSPFVRKVMVVARETGQQVEILPASLSPVSRDAGVAERNPLSKVPTAITPEGDVLYDSRVITRWLDTRHEGPRMYPDGDAVWTVLRREALADGLIEAALLIRFEVGLRPEPLRWPDWIEGQQDKVDAALEQLESEAGDFSGIDAGLIAIGCALGYLDFRFPKSGWRDSHPNLAAWFEGFSQRPSMLATVLKD